MGKGNKLYNEFVVDIWKDVFYKNIGTYVSIINKKLGNKYKLEPLSKYIKIGGGYAFKTSLYRKNGIPIIRISDFNNEKIDISNCVFYDEDPTLSKYELNTGDIIICLTGGTISKLGIVQENLGKLYLNQRVGRFDVIDETIFEREYVYWIAKSVSNTIKNLAWGAAIPNVSPKQIEKLEFAIPPKEIQKMIVSFLNDLKDEGLKTTYFDSRIEKQILKLHLDLIDQRILSSELNKQISIVTELRQAFLREAMQGKLVSNEASDGKTGAYLLQEIKTEKEKLIKEKKIKKSKPLPPISEEEIPFEIPENWAWCRVDDISSKIGSGSTPKGSNYSLDGYPFFRSQNIHNYGLVYDDIKFIDEETHQRMNGTTVYDNDLLLNITGGSLGRCALVPDDFEEGNVSQHVCIIRGIKIIPKFYHYLVLSPYFQSLIFKSTTGAGREGLPKYNLEQFIIGVPPLDIQNRIVSKLNELMKHCDDLEKSVIENQNYNELLLQQVLREALEGKGDVKNKRLQIVAEETSIYSIQNTINKNCDTGDMAILAGYIIKKLSTQNSKDFGRVKLQKMLHLVEYHCQLSSELKYQKNVAGPYAWELQHVIERKLESLRFFKIKQDEFKVTYIPLSASKELPSLFNRAFKDQAESINNLLDKFQSKTWEFCEMISTMYAVWNNRLVRKELFTDDILKQDFLAWDDKKKRFIDQLDYALEWIREEKIEPVGFGEYIDKK